MNETDSLAKKFVVINKALNWVLAKVAGNVLAVKQLRETVEEQEKRLSELEERCFSMYKTLSRKGIC